MLEHWFVRQGSKWQGVTDQLNLVLSDRPTQQCCMAASPAGVWLLLWLGCQQQPRSKPLLSTHLGG